MDYKKVVASLDYFASGLAEQIGPVEAPGGVLQERSDSQHADDGKGTGE